MYVLIYQENDITSDEEGNTIFETYEDALALKCFMIAEGFDPEDCRVAKLSFLD